MLETTILHMKCGLSLSTGFDQELHCGAEKALPAKAFL